MNTAAGTAETSQVGGDPVAILELRRVNTHYGAVHILKDLDLAIYAQDPSRHGHADLR